MDSEERDDKGRFLPGKSGNPNGRPKFSITSIIKEILEEIPEGEKRRAVEIAARKYPPAWRFWAAAGAYFLLSAAVNAVLWVGCLTVR